jgi:hypothetical protein
MKQLVPLLALASSALVACGAEPPPPAASPWLLPSEGQKDVASGTPLERYFPLVDGMVYTYKTLNEVGEEGLLVTRVYRTDPKHGELRFGVGSKTFEYVPDGVVLKDKGGEAYVLKAPLEVGKTWRGEHGGNTRVLSVTASADTPAGHYESCVQTLEERMGDRPVRYATVFCPNVGVVSLEVATGANYEHAELKTYAPPMRIKADGTERLPAGTVDGVPAP